MNKDIYMVDPFIQFENSGYFNQPKEIIDYIKMQQKEINRLNNIINKLEKYLIEMSDRSWDDNGAYDDVLDKLKALKENRHV